jgi:hypothetical protein
LGDMLDSDSSENLTSSALSGINGGHRIMNTSRAQAVHALSELLMASVS